MDDLSMGSAHGAQTVTVDQEFTDLRVHGAFVPAFVFDDLLLDDSIRILNERRSMIRVGVIKRVRNPSQLVERRFDTLVIQAQGCAGSGWHLLPA